MIVWFVFLKEQVIPCFLSLSLSISGGLCLVCFNMVSCSIIKRILQAMIGCWGYDADLAHSIDGDMLANYFWISVEL